MDRHWFDADLDPTLQSDTDQDSDPDPDPDPTPSFTHVGKKKYFYSQQCQSTLFYLSCHLHRFPNFNNLDSARILKFSGKSKVYQLYIWFKWIQYRSGSGN